MKRADLIRHLEQHGCVLFREGGNHSIYPQSPRSKVFERARHREINEFLARKICRDLEIPVP